MFLSIVMPAYNEEKRIKDPLRKIVGYLSSKGYDWEIILVDDGSIDRTSETAVKVVDDERLRIIKNETNRGKGYSVRTGVLASKGDLILMTDADLSTPIEELEKMLPWLENGYDIVIGSRALQRSLIEVPQPWYRSVMGRVFNFLVQKITLKGFKDTQCGFKCFTKGAAAQIFALQRIDGFAFDVEVLLIAAKLGFKIKEVPVRWVNSPQSSVNIFTGSASMFYELLKIRFFDWRGYYYP